MSLNWNVEKCAEFESDEFMLKRASWMNKIKKILERKASEALRRT